jgi:predicted transcriptional regulator
LDPYITLGQAIKRQIAAKGYATVEVFAHEHSIPKGTLSKILNGKVDAKVSTLFRIASALGIAVQDLFSSQAVQGNWVMERPASPYKAAKKKRRS